MGLFSCGKESDACMARSGLAGCERASAVGVFGIAVLEQSHGRRCEFHTSGCALMTPSRTLAPGVVVSPISLGGALLGVDAAEGAALLDAAVESGIALVDTSAAYLSLIHI